jgi:hypothetical protein
MDVESQSQMAQFQRRLEETIVWCTSQDWSADPAEGLRTAFFRPSKYRLKDHYDDILLGQTPPQRQHLVEQVAEARVTLLEKHGIARFSCENPLRGGRLLAFTPDGTLQDGAANIATDGFLDDDNIPPWDTWIWYVTNDPVSKPEFWSGTVTDSYLLSWVPESLIKVVNAGMDVNPEDCIRWATDLDTPFIRQLKQATLVHA